ncbi:protein phosphatase 1 regulatory subunit 3D-like [Protopterus annectens]|uniref:protein phosphatase 1 regulatory subunit 3D-like n=1 Tax=Protopterus annectens TaxID=7888 RepID=UPI001CFA9A6E|nr:protein phosphatase 1 regulatory subunit 3D-like [Protopterus annectens]
MENSAAMHSSVPGLSARCMPRNFSCTAAWYSGLSEGCKEVAENDAPNPSSSGSYIVQAVEDEAPDPTSGRSTSTAEKSRGRDPVLCPQSPSTRRRAKSLPAPCDRMTLTTTPPSPVKPKCVRFADSLGLELTSVRHFCDADLPQVPQHVMASLKKTKPGQHYLDNLDVLYRMPTQSVFLEPLFVNPSSAPDFLDKVMQRKVCLEGIRTDDFSISGTIRVINLFYEKTVAVRYSLNEWRSFIDLVAPYVPNSSDGDTDKFSFKLIAPALLEKGGTLQFAIQYCVGGQEFWDNNDGNNYKIRSHKFRISPLKEFDSAWVHFI